MKLNEYMIQIYHPEYLYEINEANIQKRQQHTHIYNVTLHNFGDMKYKINVYSRYKE